MSAPPAKKLRVDGRANSEIRPIKIELGKLARVDGSGLFCIGSTSLLASVSGPIEVRIRDEILSKATLEVNHRPLDGVAGITSKSLATSVSASLSPLLQLTLFPRSLVQLTIQTLTNPPPSLPDFSLEAQQNPPTRSFSRSSLQPLSHTAHSITASTLAFLSAASIPMIGMAIGVTVALKKNGDIIVDLLDEEEDEEDVRCLFGIAWAIGDSVGSSSGKFKGREVVWFEGRGEFDSKDIDAAMLQSSSTVDSILAVIRSQVSEYVLKTFTIQSSSSVTAKSSKKGKQKAKEEARKEEEDVKMEDNNEEDDDDDDEMEE